MTSTEVRGIIKSSKEINQPPRPALGGRKKNIMNYKDIANLLICKYPGKCAGVRTLCDDEHYNVGDDCRESYEWDTENDCSSYETTGELAGGTCATAIDTSCGDADELAAAIESAVHENACHRGDQIVIVGTPNNDGYFDQDEIRLVDAIVVAVL